VTFVMRLVWIATNTRPDMSFAANTLARSLNKCNRSDMGALDRVLRYLKSTRDLGLFYIAGQKYALTVAVSDPEDVPYHIQKGVTDRTFMYSDSGHGEEEGMKSRSGVVMLVNNAPAVWYSRVQNTVATSSTEAETDALAGACKEALFLKDFCREIGVTQDAPTKIYEDNKSCIALVTNPNSNKRSKHFAVKCAFVNDLIEKDLVNIHYCPTDLMLADILTKALAPDQHLRLTRLMGMRSLAKLRELDTGSRSQKDVNVHRV